MEILTLAICVAIHTYSIKTGVDRGLPSPDYFKLVLRYCKQKVVVILKPDIDVMMGLDAPISGGVGRVSGLKNRSKLEF